MRHSRRLQYLQIAFKRGATILFIHHSCTFYQRRWGIPTVHYLVRMNSREKYNNFRIICVAWIRDGHHRIHDFLYLHFEIFTRFIHRTQKRRQKISDNIRRWVYFFLHLFNFSVKILSWRIFWFKLLTKAIYLLTFDI